MTVACKRGFSKPKFLCENLSPSFSLSYTITKKTKRAFYDTKVIETFESPEAFNYNVLLRVFSDGVLFTILRDSARRAILLMKNKKYQKSYM